ncbi:MAG: hypothetical protein ACQERZ_10050, partial [Fusobacteriota bacterium]
MLWDENLQDKDLFEHYKKLIKIRNSKKALRYGEFIEIKKDLKKQIYGYRRKYKGEIIDVYINNSSSQKEIKLETDMYDMLSGKKVEDTIIINGKSGVILEPVNV